ncbi:uncharacterized protein LOC133644099 [Entelurus aequoreus]|uniref:uncharacterized protein LOC133644099 n=1 Tax=Entelurus aequoreus TaxID=161455 RepID=UPI002B1D80EF|nr:uncharacterized protein LOC133644099 [Entelurus aequoreus]
MPMKAAIVAPPRCPASTQKQSMYAARETDPLRGYRRCGSADLKGRKALADYSSWTQDFGFMLWILRLHSSSYSSSRLRSDLHNGQEEFWTILLYKSVSFLGCLVTQTSIMDVEFRPLSDGQTRSAHFLPQTPPRITDCSGRLWRVKDVDDFRVSSCVMDVVSAIRLTDPPLPIQRTDIRNCSENKNKSPSMETFKGSKERSAIFHCLLMTDRISVSF